MAISLHVCRTVNFLSISLHSGADSRIVREAIKTRLHEWNIGSIDCSVACWYACTCCCVQPGRGRRFGVYRACDFRQIDKTLNSWLAQSRSRHSKLHSGRTKRRLAYLPIDRPSLPATLFRGSACIRWLLRAITVEDVTQVSVRSHGPRSILVLT